MCEQVCVLSCRLAHSRPWAVNGDSCCQPAWQPGQELRQQLPWHRLDTLMYTAQQLLKRPEGLPLQVDAGLYVLSDAVQNQ